MMYTLKKIFNEFGAPVAFNANRWGQISPVVYHNAILGRSGAWVLLNDHNNSSNCANNCANNCASNVRSRPGFRRALFASPIPDTKMGNCFAESGGSMQWKTKYGHYQEGQNHRISSGAYLSHGHADRMVAVESHGLVPQVTNNNGGI